MPYCLAWKAFKSTQRTSRNSALPRSTLSMASLENAFYLRRHVRRFANLRSVGRENDSKTFGRPLLMYRGDYPIIESTGYRRGLSTVDPFSRAFRLAIFALNGKPWSYLTSRSVCSRCETRAKNPPFCACEPSSFCRSFRLLQA